MEKSEFDQISKDYIDQNKKLSSEELIHLSYEALLKHDPNIMEMQNMLRAGELMMGKGRSNYRHFEKLWWVVCEFWEYEEDKEIDFMSIRTYSMTREKLEPEDEVHVLDGSLGMVQTLD